MTKPKKPKLEQTLPPPPVEIDIPVGEFKEGSFESWEEEKAALYSQLQKVTDERDSLSKAVQAVPMTMWDIETYGGLSGDHCIMLCSSFKTIGMEPITMRIDDYPSYQNAPWDDSQLVVDAREYIERQHQIFTWNGKLFDWKVLNTRLRDIFPKEVGPTPVAWTGQPEHAIRGVLHNDVMYVARHQLRMSSCTLDNVKNFLGVMDEKPDIKPYVWRMAAFGYKPCMDLVVDRCEQDVRILEEVFLRLSDLVNVVFKSR